MMSRVRFEMKKVAVHVVAWSIYVVLYATLWRDSDRSFAQALVYNIELLPPKIILVYACILYLVPRFLVRKRYGYFVLGLLLMMTTAAVLNQVYLHFVLKLVDGEAFWDLERISKRLTYLNSPLLVALTYEGIKLNVQLTREKLNAELALLRNQLQPHFFFNTLNNLYSLVLQKSDLAPELILKLSSMMRYILYDSNKETVPLEEEVNFINNYIAIEKIRYGKRVQVEWRVPDKLPPVQFPPLLLFTFMENAFKHGVAQEMEEAKIEGALSIKGKFLIYEVSNSLPPAAQHPQRATNEGIGLKNTGQRLEIIYGNSHKFTFHKTASKFIAYLSIPL